MLRRISVSCDCLLWPVISSFGFLCCVSGSKRLQHFFPKMPVEETASFYVTYQEQEVSKVLCNEDLWSLPERFPV